MCDINSDGLPNDPPRTILFDAGMTLIHPSGETLLRELAAYDVVPTCTPTEAAAALVVAADAGQSSFPRHRDGLEKVALTWALLMELEPAAVMPACVCALNRVDLYSELDGDAHKTLQSLKDADIQLGVVSNSAGTAEHDLAAYGLLRYFDSVVDSTVFGEEKPHPTIYRHALSVMDAAANSTWFVGDSLINDVLAPRHAGFAGAILYDRYNSFAYLPGVPRIHRLAEITSVIARRHMRRR